MSSYYGDGARSAPSWDSLDAGYDEDVLDQSEYQFAARDHILFAIDASESMHKPLPDEVNEAGVVRGKSMLHQALKAIVDIERRKVLTGPSDSIGVLLYNVDPAKVPISSSQNYKPGTYVLQQLQQINAEDIKRLIKLVEEADEQYDAQGSDGDTATVEPPIISDTFPPSDAKTEMNVADMLVTCNFMFRDCGTKLVGNKRVFLITDNDDPPGSANPAPAMTVFSDLSAYGVSLNTCFLNRPGHRFDPRIYWNEILGGNDSELPNEGMEMLETMLEDLVVRTAPKRRQFTIPLKFGGRDGDIEIGVSGYSIISVQSKGQPKYVRMRGQKVDEVSTKTQYTSAETGAELDAAEITTAYQLGDEAKIVNVLELNWWETEDFQKEQAQYAEELLRLTSEHKSKGDAMDVDGVEHQANGLVQDKINVRTRVQFSDKEIASFRSMDVDPQIKIIGFQSPDNLLLQDNIKHSYFIYPDENVYTGSTRTFTALLKSCLKLNRHALALCRFRTNSGPEFCVLIPQKETFIDGSQDDPPGFHVIVLPFVDDLRDPPKQMTDNIPATDEQTITMEKIIRRLRFKSQKYSSTSWRNPALDYHQKQLQALAFDEDFDTDEFNDMALPKYAGIHKAAGKMMKEWNDMINEDERAIEIVNPPSKRNVVEVDEEDVSLVLDLFNNGNINKAKVADLRNYAKFHGISLAGKTKKADIIDALGDLLKAESKKKKAKK